MTWVTAVDEEINQITPVGVVEWDSSNNILYYIQTRFNDELQIVMVI